MSLDYQVGFNYFAEWWRVEQSIKEDEERAKNGGRRERQPKGSFIEEREKERPLIQAAYDSYKEELQAKMAKAFVQQHKTQEWFRERYIPEVHDAIRARLLVFRQGALHQWQSDLDSGLFDSFTLEGIYKTESNGVGGVLEREEGETVAAAEVLGVGDLVPSRGGDIRDESALQPALLIKTLAPMVSREKIEDFCKEHLGDQDGGFRWLSLSDPNPQKKCHRIGWIMLNPEADTEMPLDRGDGRDEDNEGADGENGAKPSLLTTAEKALEAVNGKTIYDEVRGNFVCHVGTHSPSKDPRKKALWDLFSAPERVERDLELAKRIVQKFDEELSADAEGVNQVQKRVEMLRLRAQLKDSVAASNGVKKPRKDLGDDDDEDMDGEVKEDGADSEEEEGAFDEEVDDDDLLVKKKALDLLVEYLRRVHNFCFFCVFESDSVHELIRKCPGGHLRRPRASLGSSAKEAAKASALGEAFPLKRRDSNVEEKEKAKEEASSPTDEKKPNFRTPNKQDQQLQRAFNWVKTFEDKLLQILEPENADLKKLGGVPLEKGLTEELKKFVKQEDEAKFRCKVPECTKLFKGEVFWRKHVEKRHTEWFDNIKGEVRHLYRNSLPFADMFQLVLVNTYVLDPAHIAPSRSDASSNGHFPVNNTFAPGGTPRGFNLGNMPPAMSFPGLNQGAFSGFANFGPHAVQVPAGWTAGMVTGMPNDDGTGGGHTAGPIRRGGGGGRFPNRAPGPYDRRGPRFSNGGRLSPPRGGGGGGMGGMPGMPPGMMVAGARPGGMKWADGVGAQGIGPQEAVQGRSVKSYQDLDAVGGGPGGELNY